MYKNYRLRTRNFAKLLPLLIFLLPFSIFCQTRTQQAVPNANINSQVNGFYESYPVDYSTNATRKYPLLIFYSGSGEQGDGDTQLNKVILNGPGKYIATGTFPDSFQVEGKWNSFIIVMPQWKSPACSTGVAEANFIGTLNYFKTRYSGRIDTSMIYVTGLSCGASNPISRLWKNIAIANSYAAFVSIANNRPYQGYPAAKVLAQSGIPFFALHNSGDPIANINDVKEWIDSMNYYHISPAPLLKVFNANNHEGWTKGYNPDSAWTPDGKNVYEWMLQYTNKKLVAKAGQDRAITLPQDTVITLDGSNSHARQGQIIA